MNMVFDVCDGRKIVGKFDYICFSTLQPKFVPFEFNKGIGAIETSVGKVDKKSTHVRHHLKSRDWELTERNLRFVEVVVKIFGPKYLKLKKTKAGNYYVIVSTKDMTYAKILVPLSIIRCIMEFPKIAEKALVAYEEEKATENKQEAFFKAFQLAHEGNGINHHLTVFRLSGPVYYDYQKELLQTKELTIAEFMERFDKFYYSSAISYFSDNPQPLNK